jgi:hypothetical protein
MNTFILLYPHTEFWSLLSDPKNRVYVHCMAGVSRSATIVIGYLISRHKMTVDSAHAHVKGKRRCVYPNSGFRRALVQLHHRVHGADVQQQVYMLPEDRLDARYKADRLYREYVFDLVAIEGHRLQPDTDRILAEYHGLPANVIMEEITTAAFLRFPITTAIMEATACLFADLVDAKVISTTQLSDHVLFQLSASEYEVTLSMDEKLHSYMAPLLHVLLARRVVDARVSAFIRSEPHLGPLQELIAGDLDAYDKCAPQAKNE